MLVLGSSGNVRGQLFLDRECLAVGVFSFLVRAVS
jgi:hypothetical protein